MNILALINREEARQQKKMTKLQVELERIAKSRSALAAARKSLSGGISNKNVTVIKKAPQRHLSAAARAAISAAAKRRWAKVRTGKKAA